MFNFLPLIGTLIDKVLPDQQAKIDAKIKLAEMEQNGELANMDAQLKRDLEQIAVNKIEASSPSKFKSWWRPMVGWVCAFGLAYSTVLYPLLTWVAVVAGIPTPPVLDTGVLMTALGGILGIGGMRSYEKRVGLTS